MTARDHGTSEVEWQRWGGLRSLPELDLRELPRTAVVVSPHPDDEVLGVGATMARLAAAGVRVRILAVTDGEASHPGSPTHAPSELRRLRRRERRTALDWLGLADCQVLHCFLGDGAVSRAEDELAECIQAMLEPGAWCLTTWSQDGHPDHEAAGRAGATAAAAAGARLLSYPVWTWQWALPGDLRVPWSSARQVPLDPTAVLLKGRAAQAFASQVRPLSADPADRAVMPPPMLARLVRDVEVFLE